MPISDTDLKNRIRARGVSTTDITDANLSYLISAALDEYSSYRPNVTFTASSGYLTTVAGTSSYAFPLNAITILNVFYNPDYSDEEVDIMYINLLKNSGRDDQPIDLIIDASKMAQYRRFFSGSWKIMNGLIFLIPTPELDGIKVPIVYGSQQTESTLNNIDDNIFCELVYAYCMESRALSLMNSSGFRAGSYSVSSSAGSETMKYAQKKLDDVRARLAASGIASTQYSNEFMRG